MGLVEVQPLVGRQGLLFRHGIVAIGLGEPIDDVLTLGGEVRGHVDELAPAVGEAVGHEGAQLRGEVAGESVTHLDRAITLGEPLGKDRGEVFSGVLRAGEKQCDARPGAGGDDAGGEHTAAVG